MNLKNQIGGKDMERLDWKALIDIDPPKSGPVTEQTIAFAIWNGMFTQRGPLPEELKVKIKPGMHREKIIEVINKYFESKKKR